jgi:hypothetical protein
MSMFGQILDIDLTTEIWKLSKYSQDLTRKYLGGRDLNVKCLYESIPPGTDPYGPNNILTLSCGALTGTAAPVSSRIHNRYFRQLECRWRIWHQPAFMRYPAADHPRSGIQTGVCVD